mmetsp:Transcript_20111/g.69011  ORF Transcript_20111/g.69011 Transcript_20111/m.69011 type:complete len:290 (+) Transcript_20111:532-1401(+)
MTKTCCAETRTAQHPDRAESMGGPAVNAIVAESKISVDASLFDPVCPPTTKTRPAPSATAAHADRASSIFGGDSETLKVIVSTSKISQVDSCAVDKKRSTSPPTTKTLASSKRTAAQKPRADASKGPAIVLPVVKSKTSVVSTLPPQSLPPTTQTRPSPSDTAAQPRRLEQSKDGPCEKTIVSRSSTSVVSKSSAAAAREKHPPMTQTFPFPLAEGSSTAAHSERGKSMGAHKRQAASWIHVGSAWKTASSKPKKSSSRRTASRASSGRRAIFATSRGPSASLKKSRIS